MADSLENDKCHLDVYGRLVSAADLPRLVGRSVMSGRSGPVIPIMPPHKRSSAWPKFLKDLLRKHPDCEGCGRKAETGHHVVPVGVDPTKELDENNIVLVCVPCHFCYAHGGSWQTYNPNVRLSLALRRTMSFLPIHQE